MSSIPKEIPNIGPVDWVIRQNPEYAPGSELSTEDYFLFSRCDGSGSLKELMLMSGLSSDRCVEIISKLRSVGAVLLGDEAPSDVKLQTKPEPASATEEEQDNEGPVGDFEASDEEALWMAEDVPLTEREKVRVILMHRQSLSVNYYDLLGVAADAAKREIKQSYFALSREFHPDRRFGKDLGSFGRLYELVFAAINAAHQALGQKKSRQRYDGLMRGEQSEQKAPQSKEEHGRALYERACDTELQGDLVDANKLFSASLRFVDSARAYRRAALCALRAGELELAEGHAKAAVEKSPTDPAYRRVMAEVHRAAGRLMMARSTLEEALNLRTENDALVTELQADLARITAEIDRSQGRAEE